MTLTKDQSIILVSFGVLVHQLDNLSGQEDKNNDTDNNGAHRAPEYRIIQTCVHIYSPFENHSPKGAGE